MITSETRLTGRRIAYKNVPYTQEERDQMKKMHVQEALQWEPPFDREEPIFLEPRDVGYEEAILRESETWYYIEDNK